MRTGEYPDDWDQRRERVLERDDYECQRCGASDTVLHVHHVTPISEGGSHELDNLETLCGSCHAGEHPVQTELRATLSENRRIRMKYNSYSGTRVREVEPYGLEMHEGIQYLVGYDYFREEIRYFRPTRIEWVEKTDKEYSIPEDFDAKSYLAENLDSRQGSSDCFIATAAYGTPHQKEIDRLRKVRDDILYPNTLGTLLADLYYFFSPPIAEWVSRKYWRRALIRQAVIRPSLLVTGLFTGLLTDED